jgi:hypothetical protein
MLCTLTVSPARTNASSASSYGRFVSLPDALSVKRNAVELALGILFECADPHIADALTVHGEFPAMGVSLKFWNCLNIAPRGYSLLGRYIRLA